ncbi:thioredoxin-like domain-containing protein [Aureispira]|nr:thioredoxin-like domain-containing protein [Aureispira sp.]
MIRIVIGLILLSIIFFACNNSKTISDNVIKSIVLEVKVADTLATVDTLRMYEWNAIQAIELLKQPTTKTKTGFLCKFELNQIPKGMYYVGSSLSDLKPILLGTENLVVLEGTSSKILDLTPTVSELNKGYDNLMKIIRVQNQDFMTLLTDYNKLKNNKEAQQKIKEKMAEEDKIKMKLLDSLRNENSELTRIMAFNAFQSYQNNGVSGQVEGSYFAESFFQFVDFSDSTYARLPFYYENVKNYATALTNVGLKTDLQQKALDSLFAKVPYESPNYKPTLVAAMFGVMGKNNVAFMKYAKIYLDSFKGDYEMLDKFVSDKVVQYKGTATIGELAVNIKGNTPDGQTIELSSLRGKYVLIDFWASWCGPCRKENPNVVRMYNKYKDKGFDILGVSLDNNKDKWKAAIKKDNLTWHHISDLKGWSSALSKPYGVKGIPHTVLVDKEGVIIAKKLRGHALEAKLKELLEG